jgi:hypothetical protein
MLQDKGYTMMDILSVCYEKYSHIDPKYTKEKCKNIYEDVNAIEENLTDEAFQQYDERTMMRSEDLMKSGDRDAMNQLGLGDAVKLEV